MPDPATSRPKVFISYSHQDENWKDKLLAHLSVVAREEDFEVWQDRRIEPGSEWSDEIGRQIDAASIAILLVSADFFNSDFIRNEEVSRFLALREKGGLRIYPVIVRDCTWKSVAWLDRLEVRPLDGKPLASKKGDRLETELARIAAEIAQMLKAAPLSARLAKKDQFLASFRKRLTHEYSRWGGTVSVPQSRGASRPIEAYLDVMYLPLRLTEGFDISKTDRGGTISPEDLLKREEPLVIRGPGGSGKTTWMRWTFRRLLGIESALPLMLVLRDLAAGWQDRTREGADRALDTFLESWVAENMPGWGTFLPELLAAQEGPRPVLLVDGWDEVGEFGDKLRGKLLGFLGQYPRVLAVVTSRPYGECRPSHADGFEVLDIQPLSDSEISGFTTRFFTHCHGGEEEAAQRNAVHFQNTLKNSPDARELARTVLLLTMMLLISRSRPLPDNRHQLYEACIENLLTALPNRKEQEGALPGREQWRPDDNEERMRVVAALAAELQRSGYDSFYFSTVIYRSWAKMTNLLPGLWSEGQKFGFLNWLTDSAGLLTDRRDGKLAFTHLSFQEYLAARYLNHRFAEQKECLAAFLKLLPSQKWWETLRLWAALIEKQNRGTLDLLLEALVKKGGKALMLAGAILADGNGTEERFHHWITNFSQSLYIAYPSGCDYCAMAWAASRQEARKKEFSKWPSSLASPQTWLTWRRHIDFATKASLSWRDPLPIKRVDKVLKDQLNGAPAKSSRAVAFGRLLASGPPIWPLGPIETGILQVWPGQRRLIGLRLQVAAISGALRPDLGKLFSILSRKEIKTALAEAVSGWAQELVPFLKQNAVHVDSALARDLVCDLSRYIVHDWGRGWNQFAVIGFNSWRQLEVLVKQYAYEWIQKWDNKWESYQAWNHYGGWTWAWEQNWAEAFRVRSEFPWFQDYFSIDLRSFGRASARVSLAYAETGGSNLLILLLSQACRLSLHPDQDSSIFDSLLGRLSLSMEPLWPSLARHLAWRSTFEDRALLIDLAQHPEKRKPPVSWGLQFIVRGDVMLRNGSVITLDELADEAGLPRLPYLEEMPDGFEVDWDAEPEILEADWDEGEEE